MHSEPSAAQLCLYYFFLMIRRPPRSTLDRSSAASDVYKRQDDGRLDAADGDEFIAGGVDRRQRRVPDHGPDEDLSLIHISEPTRPY